MQLTLHAEYALRVLLYVATHPEEPCSTRAISEAYGISKNHLVRVVQTLDEHGFLRVAPGRGGGITLAREASSIRLGDVVRRAEPNMRLAECFERKSNRCVLTPVCSLKPVLNEALLAFLAALDRYTLADLMAGGVQQKMAARFAQIGV